MKKLRIMVTLLMETGIFYAIFELSINIPKGSLRNLLVKVNGSSPRSVNAKDLDIMLAPTTGS